MRRIEDTVRQSEQAQEQPEQLPTAQPLYLDWDAYFDEFKKVHGEPVQYSSRILFQDGWTYHMKKEGPEWPPPTDPVQLARLQLSYWKIRLSIVKAEHDYLANQVRELRSLQRNKSLPLQHTAMVPDEAGAMKRKTQALDIDALEFGRLAWLADDVKNCQVQISKYQTELAQYERVYNVRKDQ